MPFVGDTHGMASGLGRRTNSASSLIEESLPEPTVQVVRAAPKPQTVVTRASKRMTAYMIGGSSRPEEPASAAEKWLIGGVLSYALVVFLLAAWVCWYVLQAFSRHEQPSLRVRVEDLIDPNHPYHKP